MSAELKPCPFCGAGDTIIEAARGVWNGGLKAPSPPISVSVKHWCAPTPGQPSRMIERIGKDEASAIAAWNLRTPQQASTSLSDEWIQAAFDKADISPTDTPISIFEEGVRAAAALAATNGGASGGKV